MDTVFLTVRELTEQDINLICDYWLNAEPEYLKAMGVDLDRMPVREAWIDMLQQQLKQSYAEKTSYCLIWLLNHNPVGHSNVNKIIYGKEAYMHLHLWDQKLRKKGMGIEFVKKTLPYYFKNLKLQSVYCEPYAFNQAPNLLLQHIGFDFIKKYVTTPGWLNFEQEVNLWELRFEKFQSL